MKIEPGQAALITGAGSGIGRALAVALAKKGVRISVLDLTPEGGQDTVQLVEKEHASLSSDFSLPPAIFIKCDVTKTGDLVAAFAHHQRVFGRLDICINNAGVTEGPELFYEDTSVGGKGSWRKVIDVNLIAVIDGTRLAVQAMRGKGGLILNIASAAGLIPMPSGHMYSASKGGVVMFTRALRDLKTMGIRANVLCPEFVQTNFLNNLSADKMKFIQKVGFLSIDRVIEGAFMVFNDESKAGACLFIPARQNSQYWPSEEAKSKYRGVQGVRKVGAAPSLAKPPAVPVQYQKVVVYTLSSDFRAATKIVTVPYKPPVKPGHMLIKYLYAGINASDINYSAGRYHGSKAKAAAELPLDCGFEAVGLIAGLGKGLFSKDLKLGAPVATVTSGGFSEYQQVPAKLAYLVPAATPEVVAMLTSGLTASLALEQTGRMKTGETILVTAAAGGTGQFAVQLAKIAGNKVVATCGGAEKAALLQDLGVDRVIDYKKESIKEVLKREFPKGMDMIYESVGGEMFLMCMDALAIQGRMVIIGMISQYTEGEEGEWKVANYPGLCERLLWKSQTVAGFFLIHHVDKYQEHIGKLYELYIAGKLKILIDPTQFVGVESVPDAVQHLHSGKSFGKVVVQIAADFTTHSHKSRL